MSKELIPVSHKDYQLEEAKANSIVNSFLPAFEKMKELEPEVEKILSVDIDKADTKESKKLRLQFVKIRTATATIHKTEKDYFLRAGKFCDALKKAQLEKGKKVEDDLMAIEKYEEEMEKQRLFQLNEVRHAEVEKYLDSSQYDIDLGSLKYDVWEAYKSGLISNYEKRIEAEKKAEQERKEAEIIEERTKKREAELRLLWQYFDNADNFDIRTATEDEYTDILNILKARKGEAEYKQAELEKQLLKERKEADRIKKEQEEKDKLHRAELRKAAEAEIQAKAKEQKAKEELLKKQREAELLEQKLKKEQEEKERLHRAELRKAAEAEIQAKAKEQKAKEELLKKQREAELLEQKLKKQQEPKVISNDNDKELIIAMMVDLQNVATSYKFKSDTFKKVADGVYKLLVNTTGLIKTKYLK